MTDLTEQSIREAAVETAEYLYGVEGEAFAGELEAIGHLRQLINEEFVGKKKSVSSQLIYDMTHPFITRYGLEQLEWCLHAKYGGQRGANEIRDRIAQITAELEGMK